LVKNRVSEADALCFGAENGVMISIRPVNLIL
jgi:hypothetical protein